MIPSSRRKIATGVLFALLFVATLACGITGWREVYANDPERNWWAAVYMSLLAFGGDTAYNSDAALGNGWLMLARFLGPATTITALFGIFVAVVGSQLQRLRAWLRRRHVVVVGASAFAVSLAERSASGRRNRVTVLDHEAALEALRTSERRRGTLLIPANVDDVAGTRGLMRFPERVIYGARESILNLERARRFGAIGGARVQIRIEDGSVARDLAYISPDLANADILSLGEAIARALVTGLAPSETALVRGQDRVHVALVGLGSVNLAVAEELVQRCHHPDLQPVRLSVFDRDAAAALARLRAERPGLASYDHLAIHELEVLQCCAKDMARPLRDVETQDALTAIVVATGDETRNLAIAMRLRELQLHHLCLKAPILVRSDSKGSVAPDPILDLSGGVVRLGGRTPDSEDIALQGVYENIGRSLHEKWRLAEEDPQKREAMEWKRQTAGEKRTSVRAAHAAGEILAVAGLVPDPALGVAGLGVHPKAGEAVLEDPALMERLSDTEHRRWMAERRAAGWLATQEGEARDNEKRRHDLLILYSKLYEPDKSKDRTNVRSILDHAIVRAGEEPRAGRWRRLLRVGVIGPLRHDPRLDAVVAERFRAHLRGLDLPLEAYNLEVVTPNAPGFDREAARVLLETWHGETKRPFRLLLLEAARTRAMDEIAARSLHPSDDDAGKGLRAAYLVEAARQTGALSKAATSATIRSADCRPLEASDAELAHDMRLYLQTVRAVAAHVDTLCDLLVIATAGGTANHSMAAAAARRASGRAVLVID